MYVPALQHVLYTNRNPFESFAISTSSIDPNSLRLAPSGGVKGELWIILRSPPPTSRRCPIFRLAGCHGVQFADTNFYIFGVRKLRYKVKSCNISVSNRHNNRLVTRF